VRILMKTSTQLGHWW